jgi:hypothetical protein
MHLLIYSQGDTEITDCDANLAVATFIKHHEIGHEFAYSLGLSRPTHDIDLCICGIPKENVYVCRIGMPAGHLTLRNVESRASSEYLSFDLFGQAVEFLARDCVTFAIALNAVKQLLVENHILTWSK